MPIHAYVGKPGHGKSYSVVERVVIPSLKEGRHVLTNIPLNVDDLMATFGGQVTQLPDDWDKRSDLSELLPHGAVVILDEIWRRWPNGQRSNVANELDKALLAEHRHRVDSNNNSMRIIFVTQDLQQIASWARLLVETTFRMVKLTKRAYRVDAYTGVVTGDAPPKTKLIRQFPGRFKPEVFQYYKSATQSSTGSVGDESVADKSASIFRSIGLWASILFAAFLVTVGGVFVNRFFNPPVKSNAVSQVSSEAKQPVKPAVPKQSSVIYSIEWRLAGFIHASRPSPGQRSTAVALLVNKAGLTRYVSFDRCTYYEDFQEAYCDVDGQRITSWTIGSNSILPFMDDLGGSTAQRSVSGRSSEAHMAR